MKCTTPYLGLTAAGDAPTVSLAETVESLALLDGPRLLEGNRSLGGRDGERGSLGESGGRVGGGDGSGHGHQDRGEGEERKLHFCVEKWWLKGCLEVGGSVKEDVDAECGLSI